MDAIKSCTIRGVCWALPIVLGFLAAGSPSAWGQRLPRFTHRSGDQSDTDAEKDQPAESGVLWADRSVLQRLRTGRELLQDGRYGEAVRYLGAILEAPEDYFVRPDPKLPVYQGLKAEAHRLIGEMPSKGRESYELQYGARARQLLNEAIAADNPHALAEVSRQFFHTQAGYQATLLLGLDDLERGRPLAAALTLRRLRSFGSEADQFEPLLSLSIATAWLRAGLAAEARGALVELKHRYPSRSLEIAGREVALFGDDADPIPWLAAALGPQRSEGPTQSEGWAMFCGDAARNAASVGSTPLLNMRWRVPTTDDPLIEEYLHQRSQTLRDQGLSTAPALHPLAIGDVLLMRTVRNLLAIDFSTGKRLWEIPADDRVEAMLSNGAGDSMFQQAPQQGVGLELRIWDDATYGTLSSDGRCVFSIEDLGLGAGMPGVRQRIINGRRDLDPTEPKAYNRLVAHDIRTGKLKWALGGPADQYALRQAEVFFLGPPLPLAGRLYVLAEVKEEIRLMALDAETGDLAWSQQLAAAEQSVLVDGTRRLAGASPSYADGILVCPTSAGSVVAVELSTRWLLWRYSYGRTRDFALRSPIAMQRLTMMRGGEVGSRWIDSGVTIAGGRVVFGPAESEDLVCLGLVDGKVQWKQHRQDDLYLACIDDGKAVLVGRQKIRALRLSDGQAAWSAAPTLPDGAVPSGRGFLSAHRYFVPLSTGAVATFDVAQGQTVGVSKSRDGDVPGNLICHRGRVLSQSVDAVESFFQLDALRDEVAKRLAANPKDSEALALRGEILLDADRLDDAIAALRQAYQMGPDLRTRGLLREALLEGLRRNFADHQAHAAEIERLLDDPQQRATYLRLMAAGLQESGQWLAALEHYRKMIDLDRDPRPLEPISRVLAVRRDRWLQGQLSEFRGKAAPEAVAALDRLVAQQWQAASHEGTPEALRRFLERFGSHPLGQEARTLLVERLRVAGRFLEAELLLWRGQYAGDRAQAGAGLASVAALVHEAKHPDDAALLYRQLAERYAELPCVGGKTGRELLDALPADDAVRPYLSTDDPWPTGAVEVERPSASRTRNPTYGKAPVELLRGREPFMSDMAIQLDQSRGVVQGRDGLGNVRWQVSLVEPGRGRGYAFGQGLSFAAARAHLLVLLIDSRILAVDTLAQATNASPRVLWSQDLADNGMGGRLIRMPGRNAFVFDPFQSGRPAARMALGPVTEEYVCYQRLRDCVAVHPVTGETLWVRHDTPVDSSLWGDEHYVLVVAPEQTEALVLNAHNGALLGKRKIPPAQQILSTVGRRLVVWRDAGYGFGPAGSRCSLELFDPWDQRSAWGPRKFARDSKTYAMGDEAVGVVEPDGHFVLLSMAEGRSIIDTKLERPAALSGIYVLHLGRQYIVVVCQEADGNRDVPTQPMPGCPHHPIPNGQVYAFDEQGKSLWPAPVKIANQHLIVDQPADLPVFVLASQVYHPRENNGGGQYLPSIACIDKRTGKVVLRERLTSPSSTFEISGNPEKHLVEIGLQQHPVRQTTIQLTFTDKPWPPNLPADKGDDLSDLGDESSAPSWQSKILESLWKAVQPGPLIKPRPAPAPVPEKGAAAPAPQTPAAAPAPQPEQRPLPAAPPPDRQKPGAPEQR